MNSADVQQVQRSTPMTYRAWVDAGARGYFLARSVAVNATHLINPADRRGGYFVRRDLSDPAQGGPRERAGLERRAQLHNIERDRAEWDGAHPNWIVTARVERPAEVVQRGWLTWDTLGSVVAPSASGAATAQRDEQGATQP